MQSFCLYCNSVLSEKTNTGILQFNCLNCNYLQSSRPEDSLRIEIKNNNSYEIDFNTPEDIVFDEISNRIKIDCKCGSKVGVVRIVGQECNIIKICMNCKKSVN